MPVKFYLSIPPFPPSTLFLFFLALNILLSFAYPNVILFRFYSYYYGFLLLVSNSQEILSKSALLANLLCGIFQINGLPLHPNHQLLIIMLVCLINKQYILEGTKKIIQSLTYKIVEFETVFFSIQIGIIIEFFAYFTEIKQIRVIPNLIRIMLNLKIRSLFSFIGIIRFTLKSYLVFLSSSDLKWMYLQILLSLWETAVDYFLQFKMNRVFFNKGICFYPKPIILWAFLLDSFLQWTWYFGGPYVGTLMIIKKIVWNYIKLEARSSEGPVMTIIQAILHKNIRKKQLNQIIL